MTSDGLGGGEQAILSRIRRLADGADGKILCHAEAEDGVMSALILFARNRRVILKFPDMALTGALSAHWEVWSRKGQPWAALEIVVDGGGSRMTKTGPDEYAAPEIEERIPRLVKTHFGADDWDDSDPEPPPASRRPWWRFW